MTTAFSFGRFELRPASHELLEDGQPVALGARAFGVLQALIEHRERTVTKDELLDLAWPGVVVEENNLQVQISTLRKVLGPQSIATVPGRGYRFTAKLDQPVPTDARAELGEGSEPTASPSLTNLSTRQRSLIGREDDLAALGRLLVERRLVSIVGTGGIGKTRLAEAAAQGQVGRPSGGVWWVELASLTDSLQVITAVAAAAGVSIDGAKVHHDALLSCLSSLDMLLVLDNCEHVVEAVAALVSNARLAAPSVRWLTTSIEPLRLADECVYQLSTLALPPLDAPRQQALGFGALKLFALRSSDADRKFALTDENVVVAIDICRQLDGIPLAIEMAAARVRHLGLSGVRDHLNCRLHILRGERNAPSRQQTLRATLDWSYALLSPNEKKLLRRVAVLVSGFTLDMASGVASDGELDELAILDALGGLVDKSLVQVVGGDRDEQPRYSLLETTRLYALDHLSLAGETQALLERRGRALAKWAAEISDSHLETPERVWVTRCRPEWKNLITALEWAQQTGAVDQFVPLFIAAARIAPEGGDRVVVRRHVDTACGIAQNAAPEIASQLLQSVGRCLALVSNRRAAEAYGDAVEKARTSGDSWLLYRSLVAYARLLASGSNLAAAEFTEAVIAEARALEDPRWPRMLRATLRHAEGGAFAEAGDIATARARYLEALALYTEARSEGGAQSVRLALMDIEARAGNDAEAIRLGESLLAALRGSRDTVYFPIAILCSLYARQGELARARAAAGEALQIVRRQRLAVTVYAHIALFAAHEGRVADAARLLGYADASLRANLHKLETLEGIFRKEAFALISAAMTQSELEGLMAEGALLGDAAADAIALAKAEDHKVAPFVDSRL